MQPAINDVNRILRREKVSAALNRINPTIYEGLIIPWLKRSALQTVESPTVGDEGLSRIVSIARANSGMSLMMGSVSNSLQQVTGFLPAKSKLISDGMDADIVGTTIEWLSSPSAMRDKVAESSVFMKNRQSNESAAMHASMEKILLDPSILQDAQAWTREHAYFLQVLMANGMEPIIWTAAFNAAVRKGMSNADAIYYADSLIRQTQGSNAPEDVSRMETGHPLVRLVTQFSSYFNMIANLNVNLLKKIHRETGLKNGSGRAIQMIFLAGLSPIWLAEIIAIAMRGGPDDPDKDGSFDDWMLSVFAFGTAKGLLAMVPGVGQAAIAGINRFNSNPLDDRISMSPVVGMLDGATGLVYDAYRIAIGKGNAKQTVRDAGSVVGLLLGLPGTMIARPAGYLAGMAQGKINPTGPVDFARGMITGTPSPESKR